MAESLLATLNLHAGWYLRDCRTLPPWFVFRRSLYSGADVGQLPGATTEQTNFFGRSSRERELQSCLCQNGDRWMKKVRPWPPPQPNLGIRPEGERERENMTAMMRTGAPSTLSRWSGGLFDLAKAIGGKVVIASTRIWTKTGPHFWVHTLLSLPWLVSVAIRPPNQWHPHHARPLLGSNSLHRHPS